MKVCQMWVSLKDLNLNRNVEWKGNTNDNEIDTEVVIGDDESSSIVNKGISSGVDASNYVADNGVIKWNHRYW